MNPGGPSRLRARLEINRGQASIVPEGVLTGVAAKSWTGIDNARLWDKTRCGARMTVPFEIADLFASPFRPEPSPPDRSAPSPDRSGVSY